MNQLRNEKHKLNYFLRFYLLLFLFVGVSTMLKGQTQRTEIANLYFRANTCFERKKYDSTILYYRQFLRSTVAGIPHEVNTENYRDKISTKTWRVQAHLRLALSYSIYSLYDSSLQTLFNGMKEIDAFGIENSTMKAQYCLQIGTCLLLKRDHSSALDWFKKCLLAVRGKGVTAVDAYQNIGNIYFLKADYENAIINYQKAWTKNLSLKGKNPIRLYQTLASLGTAYIENNESSKGLSCLSSAEKLLIAINSTDSIAKAGLFINVGSAYQKMNKPTLGLINYLKGLQFLREGQPSGKDARLVAYKGIATSYSNVGRYDSSLFYLQKAVTEISQEENHSLCDVPGVYCMIGDVFRIRKDYDSAFYYYQAALNRILLGYQPSDINIQANLFQKIDLAELFRILEKNAQVLLFKGVRNGDDSGCLKQSFNLYNQAIALCGRIQRDLGQEGSRLIFNDSAKSVFAGAIETAYRLWKSGALEFKETLFQLAESARGQIIDANLQERKVFKMNGMPDSLIQKQKFLNREIGLITRKKFTQKNCVNEYPGNSYWLDLEKVIDFKFENDSLIKRFERKIPGFSELRNARHLITSSGIKENLSDNEVLLEYFWADSSLYFFVFTRDSFQIRRISLEETFLSRIAKFQKSIKRADFQKFPVLSHDLYKILIEPINACLKGKNHLIIIPDEELSSLPFEAMITQKSETKNNIGYPDFHYLMKDFEIGYYFSSVAYLEAKRRNLSKPYSFLGFAPVFNNQNNQVPSFDPLASSLTEVSTIVSLFRNNSYKAEIMTDSAATKSHFLQFSGKFSHLHIATHSVIDESHPDQLGLAFAPEVSSKTQEDQGKSVLWRDEIENIDIYADLLVLSACATGKGKLTKTEGMLALPRSFCLAGVANILYTLWNIPDRQTKDFMIDFYRGFLSGKSYSAALRATKLKMIARSETSLPYLWAGFVLLGK